jgi:hypothetical protein
VIYFATCREIGRVKIGRANNVKRRLGELRVSCPLDLTLEAVTDGDEAEEIALHDRFAKDRTRGEWFNISPAIEEFIAANRIPSAPASQQNGVTRLLTNFAISQYELADRLGITQASVSRMASGKQPVSRRTEMALALVEKAIETQRAAA